MKRMSTFLEGKWYRSVQYTNQSNVICIMLTTSTSTLSDQFEGS